MRACELGASTLGCEHPIDSGARFVALFFPGGDFGDEAAFFVNAPVEALAAQDADFDFDHVQPTGVLGREVEFQAAQDAVGFWRRKGFVKCAGGMGREIVENDPDDIGVRVMEIDEIAQACGSRATLLETTPFDHLWLEALVGEQIIEHHVVDEKAAEHSPIAILRLLLVQTWKPITGDLEHPVVGWALGHAFPRF